ncbi:MAG: helix-turn-helix transcriptional regulator [Acidobacteria bacterium]|nr:helix-turn-helix transcriptional regulator [Acidobacteriota bacterium]
MVVRMNDAAEIASVIPLIYEAATKPGRWNEALVAMREILGSAAVWLHCTDPLTNTVRISAFTGFPEEVVSAYNERHMNGDELVMEARRRPLKMVLSTRVVFRGREFLKSTVFQRLLQPAGLVEAAGAAFLAERDLYAALWIARGTDSTPFTELERQTLRELFPHMARAVTVQRRILRAERLSDVTAGALDRMATGVVLMDGQGRPLLVNREARRISRNNDGFTIREDGPAAASHSDTTTLRATIREASGTRSRAEQPAGRALRLPRPSGRSDYQVVVLPLPRSCQPMTEGSIIAILFITDPERFHTPVDHLVRDLFGLTGAEVRLVMELLAGKNLTEAANTLGLSRNTVHSQLSNIFRKTGAGRQSDLVRLVLRAIAPIKGPDDSSGFYVPVKPPEAPRDLV